MPHPVWGDVVRHIILPGARRAGPRRPGARALAVLLLSAGLLGATAGAPPAAADAAPAPRVRLVAGDRSITAAWSAVPGASSYAVRIGTAGPLTEARTIVTTKRAVRLGGLRNGRAYSVRVVARGAASRAAGPAEAVRAVASSGFPLPVERVVARPGPAADQVEVEWSGGGRATKVAVVAGSDAATGQRSFHSAWYPATTRSITITVPPEHRARLGAGSGNPVWVRVVQSNGGSTAFGAAASEARGYRPSPAGVHALARAIPPEEAVSRLVVGELNVQSEAATAAFAGEHRWAARAGRLAAALNTATAATTGVGRPELLLTAELTTKVLDDCVNHPAAGQPYRCRDRTQLADLARRLDRLRVAGADAYDRVQDRGRAAPRWAGRITHGAHVLYDPQRLTLLDHGYWSPAMTAEEGFADVEGLGVPGWSSAVGPDRWLSWALLRMNDSGRRFYAVAVHLPAGGSRAVAAARLDLAARLADAIDRRAGDVPVVLGGDLNGDAARGPDAAQAELVRRGWFDAAATPTESLRTGMAVNSANLSGPQTGDPGYGAAPVTHRYGTSRIDVILLRRSPHAHRYANVLRLRPDGAFRTDLQGSDHNLQLAEVGIAGPAS